MMQISGDCESFANLFDNWTYVFDDWALSFHLPD